MADSRFEQPYSGWYWQVSAQDEESFRSRSLWDQSLEPEFANSANQTRYSIVTGPEDQILRRAERDITLPGDATVFRFIVAIDRSEIEGQLDRFNYILIYSLSALGIGLIAASLLQVFLGLKPLRNIRRSLSRIRTGEDAHLPEDFPTEIQPLADEMNALLDHNNQIVERSRTQVGNLAHALKTPLAVLLNESELHPGPLSDVVAKQADMMRRQVDHYLRRARVAASTKIITSRTEVWGVLNDICRVMRKIHKDKQFTMLPETRPEEAQSDVLFRGERQDLEEMVGNLIENAAKWSHSKVTVSCQRAGDHILIQVVDDGPGIEKSVRESVFIRGERLDENTPGTGLGLSIVKDLSGLYGGEIILQDNEPHGLLARLSLPAAQI
ncbi:MAG: HAMP domain-containing histidine kinase [Emcibacter sp.]|nr:HAMP domain-containing histidine kinase [Emcibacter sp.]